MNLSIITITMNCKEAVKRTIDSIIRQTKPIYEYIFIDGGSKDNTNEVIDSYKETLEKLGIKVIHISEKDKGISDAFNKGIKLATGDLIGIINADDELMPNTCELLTGNADFLEADIIYGNCLWVDNGNGIKYVRKPSHDLSRLYYDLVLIHPSTFVKKAAYDRNGLFNIEYRYCMDKELLLRMYIGGEKFKYIDEQLTLFRAGGISDKNVINTVSEGVRLSYTYHRPKIKTYTNAAYKIIKHKLSSLLKKTPFYSVVKGNVRKI